MAVIEDKVAEKVALRVLYDIDGTLTSSEESGISEAMKAFHERYMALPGSKQPDYLTARARDELIENLRMAVGGISAGIDDASDVENLKERLEKNFRHVEKGHTENILKIFGKGRVCSPMDLNRGEQGKPGDYFVEDLQDFESKSMADLKKKLFDYIDENSEKLPINKLSWEVMRMCLAFEYEQEKTKFEHDFKRSKTKADQLRFYAQYYPADTYVIFEDMPRNTKDLLELNDDESFPGKVIVVQATPQKNAQQYWEEAFLSLEIINARFESVRRNFQEKLNSTPNAKEVKELCDKFILMSADFNAQQNIHKHLPELRNIVLTLKKHENFKCIANDIRDFYNTLVPEKRPSSSFSILRTLNTAVTEVGNVLSPNKKKAEHRTYHGRSARSDSPPSTPRSTRVPQMFRTPQPKRQSDLRASTNIQNTP